MYADTVSLLQPTVLVVRACGVCPSSLRKVRIPLKNQIYAIILALAILVFIPLLFIGAHTHLNDITAFIYVSFGIAVLIQNVTSLITPFVTSEELVRFFVIMESVQISLFGLNIRQPPNPSKWSQVIWMVITIVPIITSLTITYSDYMVWTVLVIPPVLVSMGSFFKMRVLLDLVHEKFSLLIWHLDDLNDRWPLFLPRPADVTFREFSSVAELRRTKFVLPSHDDRAVTAEKIKEFNKAHLKLVYACRTLQRIFSIEWFTVILASALKFIMCFYEMSNSTNSLVMIANLLSVFTSVWILVVNLTLATKIKEKSDKVGVLVHDLLDEDRHAPDVVEELEQFSLALLHRKTNFSAAGFFDFDLKLVSKLASLLAPIVLFLVQNQNRPRAGRRKNLLSTAKPKQ